MDDNDWIAAVLIAIGMAVIALVFLPHGSLNLQGLR